MNSDKITEQQNPVSSHIDEKTTAEILEIINREDMGVPQVVKDSLFEIEVFIDALFPRFKDGGRLFYVGSGTSSS